MSRVQSELAILDRLRSRNIIDYGMQTEFKFNMFALTYIKIVFDEY